MLRRLTDAQVADIKAAQEKMMESAQKLFSKMYEQTQRQLQVRLVLDPGYGAGHGRKTTEMLQGGDMKQKIQAMMLVDA